MKRSILSIVIAMALTGCNESSPQNESTASVSPVPPVPPVVDPGPDTEMPPPSEVNVKGQLFIQAKKIVGDVYCDGQPLDAAGQFALHTDTSAIHCTFGNINLGMGADIIVPVATALEENDITSETLVSIDLQNTLDTQSLLTATALLGRINACPTEGSTLCLKEMDSYGHQSFLYAANQCGKP